MTRPAAGRVTTALPPETAMAALLERQVTATPALLVGSAKSVVAVVGMLTEATARSIACDE